MRAELQLIRCIGGVFTMPPDVYEALRNACPQGLVFTRQDEDMFTISTIRIADARKRQLNETYRIAMFRDVTKIAVIDLTEGYRFMPVEWRPGAQRRAERLRQLR